MTSCVTVTKASNISCFSTETSTKITVEHPLSRLVSEGSVDDDVLQDTLDNPEKVLLTFDGLDELIKTP